MKKGINLTFLILLFAFLTVSLVRTICFPSDINEYENRKTEKIKDVSVSSFLSGDLQNQMEKAFGDQALFAVSMKKSYNETLSSYLHNFVLKVAEKNPDQYIRLGNVYIMGYDRLLFGPSRPEYVDKQMKERAESINRLLKNYPDTDFYLYYIEKDTDVNFETDERVNVFNLLFRRINLPEEKTDYYRVENFEEFCTFFYKTDHHWNNVGSQRGYEEVLRLLAPKENPQQPLEEVVISEGFSGSKTQNKETSDFSETFSAYRYNYVPMDILIHGQIVADYGKQQEYFKGLDENVSYNSFYGEDLGEIVLDTHRPELENVLLIGESYDNALLKLLANHFNKTVSIDLRYYEAYMQRPFKLKEALTDYDIDKVLLIGNVDFFLGEDFVLEE